MRKLLLCGLFGLLFSTTHAQSAPDTTVYEAPETQAYPILNLCAAERHPGWTSDSVRTCGEYNLMRLISQNMLYPNDAREANIQGTVVVRLLIEPNGKSSKQEIVKDIGGGCAPEALRVIRALDSLGLRWEPATVKGAKVRAYKILPFRFKLTEALPYVINTLGDTIYTNMERSPEFKGGIDSLYRFVINRLNYPSAYKDSCKCGVIEFSLLIAPNGKVKIQEQLDFNNLGLDFQFNAIQLLNRTAGMWEPGVYQGRSVPATTPVRVLFKSDAKGCAAANERFDKAMVLAEEAAILNETGKTEEAIQQFNQALALDPNNTELLYYRGTLLLNSEQKDGACQDFNRIKAILGYTWFEQVRKLICGW